jgi:hypothetical protein
MIPLAIIAAFVGGVAVAGMPGLLLFAVAYLISTLGSCSDPLTC